MQARARIQNLECTWMQWLRRCSDLKGVSGSTLLQEYANDKGAWQASLHRLRSERAVEWMFLRGQLSVADIADARRRYLEKYVFVAGEHDADAYVEALLTTEQAQIQLRLEKNCVTCTGCADRDAEIAKLRLALQARDLCTYIDIDAAAISTLFYRYYMLSEKDTCTRTDVRKCIERAMQEELGTGIVINNFTPSWVTFLRDRMGLRGTQSIYCKKRRYPLPAEPESAPGSS